jgi:hypothetical protein
MPPKTAWEWLEAYGAITADPEKVHGDWAECRAEVNARLEEIIPAAKLNGMLTDTKPMACCAAGDALDKEAPRRKELDRTATPTSAATTNSGFTQVDDDELPF